MTGWPQKDIPEEYLQLARKLVNRQAITQREFIELCLLAVKYIDSGVTTISSRSDMALYIANLWLRHPNLDIDLLDDIGGQFAEWDRPGTFVIEGDRGRQRWGALRSWIFEADRAYKRKHEQNPRKEVAATFLDAANKLLRKKYITRHEFITICNSATKVMESDESTLQGRKNTAFYIVEIADQHLTSLNDELLDQIISKFSTYESPDAFNFNFILEKHSWEELKVLLSQAALKNTF